MVRLSLDTSISLLELRRGESLPLGLQAVCVPLSYAISTSIADARSFLLVVVVLLEPWSVI